MIKIIRHYYISESVYNWVRGLAKWDELSSGTYDLFVSLLTRSAWRYKTNDDDTSGVIMYSLHSKWLQKNKINIKAIPDLIETDNFYIPKSLSHPGKSKYYWVKANILRAFESLAFSPGKHCINLYTGLKARQDRDLPTDIQKPSLYDKNRNLITSELVAKSINIVSKNRVTINLAACKQYTDRLNGWFSRRYNKTISNPTLRGRLVKNTRIANFLFAHLNKFRDQKNIDIAHYQPCYKPTFTGRITEKYIGLQGCSRTMRKRLLSGIACINFDMQNSQLSCLHYLLPPGEIKDALAKKTARLYSDAASFGLPKRLVKPYIYSLVFNCGKLHKNMKAVRAITQYCRKKHLLTNLDDFTAGLTPLIDATTLLLSLIREKYTNNGWINHAGIKLTPEALEAIAEKKLQKYLRKGRRNLLFSFDTANYKHKAKNKSLIALYLQGIEMYVIHTLTVNGSSDTYTVISNQHDGLIIMGDKNALSEQMAKINKAINANFIMIVKPI